MSHKLFFYRRGEIQRRGGVRTQWPLPGQSHQEKELNNRSSNGIQQTEAKNQDTQTPARALSAKQKSTYVCSGPYSSTGQKKSTKRRADTGQSYKPRQLISASNPFLSNTLGQYDTANTSTLSWLIIFRLCFQAATRARPCPLLTTEDTRQMVSHY